MPTEQAVLEFLAFPPMCRKSLYQSAQAGGIQAIEFIKISVLDLFLALLQKFAIGAKFKGETDMMDRSKWVGALIAKAVAAGVLLVSAGLRRDGGDSPQRRGVRSDEGPAVCATS